MQSYIILVLVGFVIVVIAIVLVAVYQQTMFDAVPTRAGNKCTETSDCATGLWCERGRCLIPEGASCGWQPCYCAQGQCVGGVCLSREEVNRRRDELNRRRSRSSRDCPGCPDDDGITPSPSHRSAPSFSD